MTEPGKRGAKPPDRTTAQRFAALAKANEVRLARSKVKKDMKARKITLVEVLSKPPACLETAKVAEIIMAAPRYGKTRTNKILTQAHISPSKHIGGLTPRQQKELLENVYRYGVIKDRDNNGSTGST